MIHMVRWKWVLPRLVLLAAASAAVWFGLNPLVRWAMIASAQRMTGAVVEIERLEASAANTELRLQHVQLADPRNPMENLVEAREVSLALETGPLLRKQYVVREGRISGLRFGSPRQTSGALNKKPSPECEIPEEAVDGGANRAGEFGERCLERLLGLAQQQLAKEVAQLESVQLARELSQRWPAEFAQLEARVKALRERIERLRPLMENGGRDAKTLLRDVDGMARAAADLEQIQREVLALPQEIDRLAGQALRDKESILVAKDRDLARVRQQLDPENLTPEKFSEYLLGPEAGQHVVTVVQWINWARKYMPAKVEDSPEPVRGRGVEVLFAGAGRRPDFLVQRVSLDGEGAIDGAPFQFAGTAENLTAQPALCGRPAVLKLELRGKVAAQLEATFDRTQPAPHDHVKLECPGIAQPPRALGRPERFAVLVSPGAMRVSLDVHMVGDDLSGRMVLRQEPVELIAEVGADPAHRQLAADLEQALAPIRSLEIALDMGGTLKKPRWQIHSDLGPQIAAALNGLIQRQWQAARAETAAAAQRAADQELARFEQLVLAKQQKLLGDQQLTAREIQELRQLVASRVPRADDVIRKNLPANLPFRF